ncbi:hypothetical protein Tco_0725243 [Tanacetum coccineum]|uniref:Reverse transcriptase domain-containing protein n=1 Tax=Tanacetum coccineum TaxID=301880 RepID=A0ABQ4YD86_9ASTR
MGDENPIHTLGNYSKPSHEGYRNTIEFPVGNNMVPQTLGTTFEARVRDYMAAHTKRMERFKNAIFKEREEINGRMTEMFRLLKELTTSRTPEKLLIRSNKTEVTPDNTEKPSETKTKIPVREAEAMNGAENGARNELIKTLENDEAVEASGSQPVAYYLKHKINEKLIKRLVKTTDSINLCQEPELERKTGRHIKYYLGDLFMTRFSRKEQRRRTSEGILKYLTA